MEVAGSSGEISFSVKTGGSRKVLSTVLMVVCLPQDREARKERGAERLEGMAG